MTLDSHDVVWLLDGRGGISRMLADLVGGLMVSLQALMPPSALDTFDDPFSGIVADADFDALMHLDGVRMRRLFPQPVDADHDADHTAWESLVRNRATTMHRHASRVLADIEGADDVVPVTEGATTAWLQTLGALRAGLHADLTDSASPAAEPTLAQLAENPALAAVLDWLAFNVEDLLATRDACLSAGAGLDLSDIEEWE